jgi:drug/metabolite transporter (DMT)-like permease
VTSIAETSSSTKNSIPLRVILTLVFSLGVASFAAVLIKLTQDAGMPSPVIAAERMTIAALIITPIVLTRYMDELKQLNTTDILLAIFAGFWMVSHFIALIYALDITSVLIVLIFSNSSPIWIALLETTLLKEKMSQAVFYGMAIAILGSVGIAVTSNTGTPTEGIFLGGGLALLASLGNSGFMVIGRRVRPKVSLLPYVWMVFGSGGIIGMVIATSLGFSLVGHPIQSYFWLFILAVVIQIGAHSGFNYALAYIPATVISILGQSITVTGTLAAFLVYREVPNPNEIIGGMVIILGVIITILGRANSSRSNREAE